MMIRSDRLPDLTRRGEERPLAVVSRLVTVSGKTIRHIVIFDNHPDSIRLLLRNDFLRRPRNDFLYAVLSVLLVAAAGLGIFWPLL